MPIAVTDIKCKISIEIRTYQIVRPCYEAIVLLPWQTKAIFTSHLEY